MRRRALTIALVLFQALWLNVIIPGHTRGAITLPGFPKSQTTAGSCCHPTRDAGKHAPTPSDRAHCAVCFLAALTTAPPIIDLSPPKLGLCYRLRAPPVPVDPSVEFVPTYYACGPPSQHA